ncbi:hypothetical protein GW17_00031281 [Ensete ventricosum]|nr:hypothetical protein GW17_00031281 [Ensete ventricosum]
MWYRRKWVAAAVATVGKGRMEGKRERHSGSWKREKREEREVPSKRRWCLLVAALRAELGRIKAEDWNYPGSNSITLKRGLDSSGGVNLRELKRRCPSGPPFASDKGLPTDERPSWA